MPIYNLIYHLCLININPIVYFNIREIKQHLHKFNGKKIINVNYDDLNIAQNFIQTNFSEYQDICFVFTDNSSVKTAYEILPFINKLMPMVYSLNDNEYTFYGHSKGVTKYYTSANLACLLWAYTMYNRNLTNFDYISTILKNYSCCGTLKIDKPIGPLHFVPWHYSGAFFWFKNKDIFSKTWQNFYHDRFGLEGYLGMHIDSKMAYAISPKFIDGYENPYEMKNWNKLMADYDILGPSKILSYDFDKYL